jgi:lipopolysaccharide/colanic/teichoic acid biosynthesis glycosyltransferase
MSIVGPKPEPLEWFHEFGESIKFLHRRIIVRPGLTGLAQIKYHYELSQKVLEEWVKYDIYYTENMSLRMDLGLLLRTILLVFRGQNGKKNVLISKSTKA